MTITQLHNYYYYFIKFLSSVRVKSDELKSHRNGKLRCKKVRYHGAISPYPVILDLLLTTILYSNSSNF